MARQILKWIRQFLIALRIFSLTLAFAAVATGILGAYRTGKMVNPLSLDNILLIGLVMVAGILSQAGANLINDFFEGSFKYKDPSSKLINFGSMQRSPFDLLVFLSGLAALGIAGLIGLYLIFLSGWTMLVIGLTGLIGSYAYTGEPFVYKRKGLGVPLSFLLMGPLMSLGAWYPFARELSWYPVLLSLPVSLLVPALMISNEMRDFKRDKNLSMGTLSIRLGSKISLRLYELLVGGCFVLITVYALIGFYPIQSLAALAILPVALKARMCVARFDGLSIPWTNRVHLGVTVITVATLLLF